MDKAKWVIASSSDIDLGPLDDDIDVVTLPLASFERICEAVRRLMPEYLAVDMIMPGGDASEVARYISRSRAEATPVMLALVPDGMMEAARLFTKGVGIHALLPKPVTGADLLRAVETADIRNRLPCYGVDRRSISKLLWTLGFSPAMRGAEYVLTAIDLLCRDMRAVTSMSKSLYPAIADMYCDDKIHVEQAMRRATESAWSAGSPEKQYSLFGNSIDEFRGKPTLRQMFACVAERLHSGMEIDI